MVFPLLQLLTKGAKPAHTLPGAAGAADLVAHKMAVKFDRNEALPASLDVSKRSFYLAEGRIRTLYHCECFFPSIRRPSRCTPPPPPCSLVPP